MFKKLFLKFFWHLGRHTRLHSINRSLAEINHRQILEKERYQDKKNLINFGFKVYSQSDEDGIIEEIFKRINISSKVFIELGVQDGKECNSLYLLKSGWKGLWMDMSTDLDKFNKDFEKFLSNKLIFKKKIITKENVNSIINDYKSFLGNEIDLLSIDLSKNTFHILKNFEIFKPRVIVTEYNAKLRDKIKWECEYDNNGAWDGSDNFGASLKSFEIMMREKNYLLVGCNITGVNAFFVRGDCINEKFFNEYTSEFHYEPLRMWLIKKYENELKVSI